MLAECCIYVPEDIIIVLEEKKTNLYRCLNLNKFLSKTKTCGNEMGKSHLKTSYEDILILLVT